MTVLARFALLLASCLSSACGLKTELRPVDTPRATLSVSPPFCAYTTSCLLGRVTRGSQAVPVANAAVFVKREDRESMPPSPTRIGTDGDRSSDRDLAASLATNKLTNAVVKSDLDGFFAFAGLAQGTYFIEVYGTGPRELGLYTGEVEIPGSGVTFVEIRVASLRRGYHL